MDFRAGCVADRIRNRGRSRNDRRFAQSLRAEVRQVLVRLVDELANDLRHVRDRGQLVRVERLSQRRAALRVDQPFLGQGVAEPLDDSALDLALGAERVDDPADVMDRRDPFHTHLAGLDVDRDLGNLDPEGQDSHSGRVRPAGSLTQDLGVLEQSRDLLERPRGTVA